MSESSFNTIKLAATEFNTANMIATRKHYNATHGPQSLNFVRVFKDGVNGSSVLLEYGLHNFVVDKLGLDMTNSSVSARGDVRLFKYPDGSAGALIERTGQIIKLEEIPYPRSEKGKGTCTTIVPVEIDDVSVKVRYVDRVPTNNKGFKAYNMAVAEGFDTVLFIDQMEGRLFSYDLKETKKIFDVTTDPSMPSNIDVNHGGPNNTFPQGIFKIHQVSPGPDSNSIYVVFTSNTSPAAALSAVKNNTLVLPSKSKNPAFHIAAPFGAKVSIYARCL